MDAQLCEGCGLIARLRVGTPVNLASWQSWLYDWHQEKSEMPSYCACVLAVQIISFLCMGSSPEGSILNSHRYAKGFDAQYLSAFPVTQRRIATKVKLSSILSVYISVRLKYYVLPGMVCIFQPSSEIYVPGCKGLDCSICYYVVMVTDWTA